MNRGKNFDGRTFSLREMIVCALDKKADEIESTFTQIMSTRFVRRFGRGLAITADEAQLAILHTFAIRLADLLKFQTRTRPQKLAGTQSLLDRVRQEMVAVGNSLEIDGLAIPDDFREMVNELTQVLSQELRTVATDATMHLLPACSNGLGSRLASKGVKVAERGLPCIVKKDLTSRLDGNEF